MGYSAGWTCADPIAEKLFSFPEARKTKDRLFHFQLELAGRGFTADPDCDRVGRDGETAHDEIRVAYPHRPFLAHAEGGIVHQGEPTAGAARKTFEDQPVRHGRRLLGSDKELRRRFVG